MVGTHDGGGPLRAEEVFRLLGNDRRRMLVLFLGQRNGPLTLDEAVENIVLNEDDGLPAKNHEKSVRIALQQAHLPKLIDAGVVVTDDETHTLEPGPTFGSLYEYVSEDSTTQTPDLLYAALGAVGFGLVLLGAMDVLRQDLLLGSLAVVFALLLVGGLVRYARRRSP